MESSFNTNFSNINIKKDSKQATDVGALAFTQGNNVHFAPGQFKPQTKKGQELIGHEFAHVVQQREGKVKANKQIGKFPINDNKDLEKQADEQGKKAADGVLQKKHNKATLSNNKVIQAWKPDFNKEGDVVLERKRKDNAETFMIELKLSGYEITPEEAKNIVNDIDGKTQNYINLNIASSKLNKLSRLSELLDIVKGQYHSAIEENDKPKTKDIKEGKEGNCVKYALSNNKGYIEIEPWDEKAQKILDSQYDRIAEEDINNKLKACETRIRYRNKMYGIEVAMYEDGLGMRHISRFIWQDKNNVKYAISKDSNALGLIIGKVDDSWNTFDEFEDIIDIKEESYDIKLMNKEIEELRNQLKRKRKRNSVKEFEKVYYNPKSQETKTEKGE